MNKDKYIYKAFVTRVVDGDTIDVLVDLGFGISSNTRFRMAGYDAPESWRPSSEEERIAGVKAKTFLADLVEGMVVVVKSIKKGKYRYVCELFLEDDEQSVNEKMVEAGHVK